MDLTDIYRTLHLTTAECTFFSSAYAPFSIVHYVLGQKTSLKNFLKMEIISIITPGHNGMKLEIKSRRKIGKFT